MDFHNRKVIELWPSQFRWYSSPLDCCLNLSYLQEWRCPVIAFLPHPGTDWNTGKQPFTCSLIALVKKDNFAGENYAPPCHCWDWKRLAQKPNTVTSILLTALVFTYLLIACWIADMDYSYCLILEWVCSPKVKHPLRYLVYCNCSVVVSIFN